MFKFRLALALGRTVRELDESLTSRELTYWIAFFGMCPFGPERDNLHAAMIASIMANAHRGKNSRPFKIDDFMIKDRQTRKDEETQNVLAFLSAHAKPKE